MREGGSTLEGAAGKPPPGCRDPKPHLGPNGEPTGFVECAGDLLHRVEKLDCPSTLPRSGPPCASSCIECTLDTDCAAKAGGYCSYLNVGEGGAAGYYCKYGCIRDSDCAAGEICECGDPVGTCITAHCTVDADCGGRICVASALAFYGTPVFTHGWGAIGEYSCQNEGDECLTCGDCAAGQTCTLLDGRRSCRTGWPPCY